MHAYISTTAMHYIIAASYIPICVDQYNSDKCYYVTSSHCTCSHAF
jgi:hypothetical protein